MDAKGIVYPLKDDYIAPMKKDYSVISYVWKVYRSGGTLQKMKASYRVKKSKTVRYHNCLHKLAHLSKCAEMFLWFITEEMDYDNNISHTAALRRKFIKFMSKNCSLHYKDDTVKKAFKQLLEQDLIISFGVKIDYAVNPRFFFNGTEGQRVKLIQKLIYWANTNPAPDKSNIKRALGYEKEGH